MFSQKTLTALLTLAILALSYQTWTLLSLKNQLAQAKIGFGAATASVSTGESAPDMVGGC